MNVILKFLEHYSFRFPKGYPDLNDFNDKKLRWQEMNEEILASKSREAFLLNNIVKSIFSKE